MVSTSIPTLSIAAISSAKAQTWQDRRRYLLSLAIGRSDIAKITPFEKYVNKFCVSGGSEPKKSLTFRGLGVVSAPQIAQISGTFSLPEIAQISKRIAGKSGLGLPIAVS